MKTTLVADSFHTKPLHQCLQSVGLYQMLALSRHQVQLFEGNRHALDAMALAPGVPQTMTEALGDERTEPHSTVSSYGGIGAGHGPMHHGQGSKKDEIDGDAERFFRSVDRAVLEHSRPSGLPLMLAALPEHHHLFHAVSHNPFLMGNGLMVDPQGLTPADLLQRAWEAAAPQQQAQQAASSDATTGRIDPAELRNPRVDDVLDDLGALVEKMGGQVHVLPADRMPGRTGVAASFRH